MASAYEGEGGAGGKFRRRPFRKSAAASTPYDRPSAADRPVRFNRDRNGWISKFVDPASRMIAAGASRFFSSVFTKRLAPPPPPTTTTTSAALPTQHDAKVTVADPEFREDVTDAIPVVQNTSPPKKEKYVRKHTFVLRQTTEERGRENPSEMMPEGVVDVESTKDKADGAAITELEQVMKQKTFTRVEFDRLTELLRSRTIDLSVENEVKKSDPSTSQTATRFEKQERDVLLQENGIRSSKLLGGISRPASSVNVPEEEIASPTELAKAYMGSRPLNLSPPTSGLRYPALRDVSTLSGTGQSLPQSSNGLVAPRSVVCFSGLAENGYRTPRPQGRSAIYKMSRSPYFKAQPMISFQGHEPSGEGNAGHVSSHRTRSISGGKQVLKRRSSFIENDSGSFGPIRRIRQKSNMVSPLKENFSSTGRFLSTQAANGLQGSAKPLLSNGVNHDTSVLEDAVDGMNKSSHESFASVPRQSSLMARKILQQLDHLVPSPKEKKSSAQKAITNDRSPSKLTFNMLNGPALNSVKDIDSSNLYNAEGGHKISGYSGVFKTTSEAPTSQMQDRLENNGPSKATISGVKIFSEVGASDSVAVSVSDKNHGTAVGDKPGVTGADLVFSSASATPKRPSFLMQAPESSWELEADNYVGGNASDPATTGKEIPKSSVAQTNCFIGETTLKKKPSLSSSESREADNRGPDRLAVFNKNNGFKFPAASSNTVSSHTLSVPPLSTSTEKLTALKEQVFVASAPQKAHACSQSAPGKEKTYASSATVKEQTSVPLFSFGSKSIPVVTFSSTSSIASESSSLKFDAKSDPKVEVVGSTAITMTTSQTETPGSDKGKEAEMVGQSLKPFGFSIPSGSFVSAVPCPAFGAPITSAPSNGSSKLMPSASVSVAPMTPLSGILAAPTVSSFSTSQVSGSASVLALPPVPSRQEISGTTAISIDSTATTVIRSNTEDLKPQASKESSFSLNNFSTPAAAPTFSSSGSSLFGFSFSAPSTTSSMPGQLLNTQPSQVGSGASIFTQSSTSQFGSSSSYSAPGLSGSSVSSSGSAFGSLMAGAKPFSFGSSSEPGQSSLVSFNASGTATSSSYSAHMTTASLFSSSQPASSSIFGSGFASGSSSSGFSFGLSPASSGTSSVSFGAASAPAFSFTSVGTSATSTPLSPPQTGFGMPAPVTFGSSLAGNDQMSVEDSMTDDTVQAVMPVAPAFGQATTPPMPPISFGSPAVQPGGAMGFQFVSQPVPAFPQAQSPFQASGNLEFTAGGSFSLGSGGGDKSNRRILKVKRTTKGRK